MENLEQSPGGVSHGLCCCHLLDPSLSLCPFLVLTSLLRPVCTDTHIKVLGDVSVDTAFTNNRNTSLVHASVLENDSSVCSGWRKCPKATLWSSEELIFRGGGGAGGPSNRTGSCGRWKAYTLPELSSPSENPWGQSLSFCLLPTDVCQLSVC